MKAAAPPNDAPTTVYVVVHLQQRRLVKCKYTILNCLKVKLGKN